MTRKSYKQRWGERVALGRTTVGLSQTGLADAVDVTQQTISSIERGETAPGELLKLRISRALHQKPERLFPMADVEDDPQAAVAV